MINLDRILRSRDVALPTKICIVKAVVFLVICGFESWTIKKADWCFWTMVLKKTLENPLDYKEIKPVNPKGNQSWIFNGMTDAETPILWQPDTNCWPTGKTLMLGKVEGRKRRGWPEDELVGWNRWFNTHEFEQALGHRKGQGNLECCSLWGCKELDMTELLNSNTYL